MKKNETVVFSYIVYKSRAARDKCLAKVMKDKRLAAMMDPKKMPFDAKRMIYGGFKVSVAHMTSFGDHTRCRASISAAPRERGAAR